MRKEKLPDLNKYQDDPEDDPARPNQFLLPASYSLPKRVKENAPHIVESLDLGEKRALNILRVTTPIEPTKAKPM